MDVGAEYDHYTADVTRTFPISGKFSKEQAIFIRSFTTRRKPPRKRSNPARTLSQSGKAAADVIKQGLAKIGLITAPDATIEASFNGKTYPVPQYTLWYMHGWGHWLGMNVHDVGEYGAAFKPGMVMTNEPGIYIREDALDYLPDTPENKEFIAKIKPAFEKYKNIGVRIEDDMLVTETGAEWMTKKLPRTMADIEAFMAKSSREFSANTILKNRSKNNVAVSVETQNIFLPDYRFGLFNSTDFPQGGIAGRGSVLAGKRAVQAGLNHAGHSDEN